MLGRPATFLLATALLGFATIVGAVHGRNARQSSTQEQSPREEERAKLLATGKELFVERCAKCHNERGDKPLKTGAPLNERGLSTEVIARAVNGRLRDRTEEERRGVTLYIASLMKAKGSENSPPKPWPAHTRVTDQARSESRSPRLRLRFYLRVDRLFELDED